MDDEQLADAFMRKVWRKRDEIHYADAHASINHVWVGGHIWTLLKIYGKPGGNQTTPPRPWEPGWSDHAMGMLMGIGIIPSDTLNAGEWQLRDHTGTVRAFGTLDDLKQEHQP